MVFKNDWRENSRSIDAVYSCIVLCVSDAKSLSDDAAGERGFLSVVSVYLIVGEWHYGQLLYAGLYAELFTISPQGWRMVLTGAVEFLSGNIIPLPFFPRNIYLYWSSRRLPICRMFLFGFTAVILPAQKCRDVSSNKFSGW